MRPYSTPRKHQKTENLAVFWCFQGVEKGCIWKKWVNNSKFPHRWKTKLILFISKHQRIARKTRFKYIWVYSGVPIPANIYLFKVNNRNTTKRCEICSKLTIKTPTWRHWRRSGFFGGFWTYFTPISSVYIVDFEQIDVRRVVASNDYISLMPLLHHFKKM